MSDTTDHAELIAELVKLGNAVDEFTIGVPAELRAATALEQSARDLAAAEERERVLLDNVTEAEMREQVLLAGVREVEQILAYAMSIATPSSVLGQVREILSGLLPSTTNEKGNDDE